MRAVLIGSVCLIGAAVPRAAGAQTDVGGFVQCQPEAGQAWSYDHLMCLRQAGLERRQLDEARRRLIALGAGDPSHPWPTLVLAHLTLDELRRDEAIALYERAAEAFAQLRDADGEVIARQNLANQFRLRGDVKTAAGHVARAVAAAEASGQPLTIARAAVIDAAHAMVTGGDIGRAHRELVRADHLASAGAPIGLRRTILFNLANANLYLGHAEDALEALDRHRALRAEDRSTQNAATVEFNRLVAQIVIGGRRPDADIRARLVADAEAVVAEARGLNDPLVEAQAHKVLGDLLGRFDPARAGEHLDRCLELEATLRSPSLRVACLWSRAQLVSARDPRQAERLSQQALSLISSDRERLLLAFAWQARLRLVWSTLPLEAAIGESFEALDAIERLRASQNEERGRTALFGNWARDYEWLTGQLLETQPPRVAQAFEVGERLRARVLLERLTQIGVPNAPRPRGLSPIPMSPGASPPRNVSCSRHPPVRPSERRCWHSCGSWSSSGTISAQAAFPRCRRARSHSRRSTKCNARWISARRCSGSRSPHGPTCTESSAAGHGCSSSPGPRRPSIHFRRPRISTFRSRP